MSKEKELCQSGVDPVKMLPVCVGLRDVQLHSSEYQKCHGCCHVLILVIYKIKFCIKHSI